MDKPVNRGVPKALFVLIIVILGGMYYFATFHDVSNPEVTVRNFYGAYFEEDYETVAKNLSVFWGVQFMPEYMMSAPQELIENRPAIEEKMSVFIAQVEADSQFPDEMDIRILSQYTQRTDHTAMVAYEITEGNESVGLEMALLLKENNRMYMYKMMPANEEYLQQLGEEELLEFEASYLELFEH